MARRTTKLPRRRRGDQPSRQQPAHFGGDHRPDDRDHVALDQARYRGGICGESLA